MLFRSSGSRSTTDWFELSVQVLTRWRCLTNQNAKRLSIYGRTGKVAHIPMELSKFHVGKDSCRKQPGGGN